MWIIDLGAQFRTVQLYACFITDSGPPPSVKGRMEGGVQNPMRAMDLRTLLWTVQIYTKVIADFGPPPLSVKGRTSGGVWNAVWTVDLSSVI